MIAHAAGEQTLPGTGPRHWSSSQQHTWRQVETRPTDSRQQCHQKRRLVSPRSLAGIDDGDTAGVVQRLRVSETEGPECPADQLKRGFCFIPRRLLWNASGEIRHILAPHAGSWVVAFGAVDCSVVLKQRRGGNPVQGGKLPLAPPL